jgi:decaprenylphospho-beta-D-ribofuranose 2-oxidase
LSFPTPGWTLSVDIPIPSVPSVLEQHLRGVDEALVEAGGRIYLAKDSRMRADLMTAMYPQLDMFEKVRRNVDPDQMFRSDLSVRLGI